jgi:hypothetical protein
MSVSTDPNNGPTITAWQFIFWIAVFLCAAAFVVLGVGIWILEH